MNASRSQFRKVSTISFPSLLRLAVWTAAPSCEVHGDLGEPRGVGRLPALPEGAAPAQATAPALDPADAPADVGAACIHRRGHVVIARELVVYFRDS